MSIRLLVFIVLCINSLGWLSLGRAADKPNLVVFISDDLGGLDLSPYGSQDVRTPNMQRLAERGLRFT
ncbi:MAG TPA: hypothetical protein VGJ16_13060, partial [Pirellulales bacterium]